MHRPSQLFGNRFRLAQFVPESFCGRFLLWKKTKEYTRIWLGFLVASGVKYFMCTFGIDWYCTVLEMELTELSR